MARMGMSLTSESLLVQDSEPIAATIDEDVVMLSVRAGAYFGLNDVGSEIWNMLATPRRLGDVCRSLSSLYEVDDETVARDVFPFLQMLVDSGLVRMIDQGQTIL